MKFLAINEKGEKFKIEAPDYETAVEVAALDGAEVIASIRKSRTIDTADLLNTLDETVENFLSLPDIDRIANDMGMDE